MENQTGGSNDDSHRQPRHRRVVLFPLPEQGHINPTLQLANVLYSKGFNITILHTKFRAPNASNYPHFTFKTVYENETQEFGVSQFMWIHQHGADAFRQELELLIAASSGKHEKVSCLITDESWCFTQSVADSLNLPRLVLRVSCLLSFLVGALLPVLDARGYFQPSNAGSASSFLEEDRTFFPWLDKQPPNSVLYVSFGSTTHMDEKDFLELAYGLAESKQSFLWVVRPRFINGSTWIEQLPDLDGLLGESGRIVKWAPQHEVLAHKATGAFWTHCGWNSAMESICEGVPMICWPFRIDQPLTARCMSQVWKNAVYPENVAMQREEIASLVKKVMADEEMRKRAKLLKEKLEASLIKGGSSYESLESLVNHISSF